MRFVPLHVLNGCLCILSARDDHNNNGNDHNNNGNNNGYNNGRRLTDDNDKDGHR